MTAMTEQQLMQRQGKRAAALTNQDFICIETYSGRGRLGADPQAAQHLLRPDVADELLGRAVLDALKFSRFLSMDEYHTFFDPDENEARYAAWIASLMERYGYKTKRALFKNMKNCGIQSNRDTLIFSPTYHDKLEGWSGEGIAEDDLVVIPASSSPAEVGRALKEALVRCI
jgi:hypothetical protein